MEQNPKLANKFRQYRKQQSQDQMVIQGVNNNELLCGNDNGTIRQILDNLKEPQQKDKDPYLLQKGSFTSRHQKLQLSNIGMPNTPVSNTSRENNSSYAQTPHTEKNKNFVIQQGINPFYNPLNNPTNQLVQKGKEKDNQHPIIHSGGGKPPLGRHRLSDKFNDLLLNNQMNQLVQKYTNQPTAMHSGKPPLGKSSFNTNRSSQQQNFDNYVKISKNS